MAKTMMLCQWASQLMDPQRSASTQGMYLAMMMARLTPSMGMTEMSEEPR